MSWRLLPLIFVVYVANYLDRTNVGLAALQMNRELGLSSAAYGFGAGVFFIGYGLFRVPSNLFLARVGARRWIARIAITWGILACAMMPRAWTEELLPDSLSARRGRGGMFPRNRFLSQQLVSGTSACERHVALHGECSARRYDRRPAWWRAAFVEWHTWICRLAMVVSRRRNSARSSSVSRYCIRSPIIPKMRRGSRRKSERG